MNQVTERIDEPDALKLHRFQEYLRDETDLGPGTVVQYRREIGKVMNQKGLTSVTLSEVEGHSRSAFRKYLQWLENRDIAKTTDEGDSGGS